MIFEEIVNLNTNRQQLKLNLMSIFENDSIELLDHIIFNDYPKNIILNLSLVSLIIFELVYLRKWKLIIIDELQLVNAILNFFKVNDIEKENFIIRIKSMKLNKINNYR